MIMPSALTLPPLLISFGPGALNAIYTLTLKLTSPDQTRSAELQMHTAHYLVNTSIFLMSISNLACPELTTNLPPQAPTQGLLHSNQENSIPSRT